MRRFPGLAFTLLLLAPAAWGDDLDPARHLWYQAPPGSIVEYDVTMYYDWSRTSSQESARLAAAAGAVDGGEAPGQPWYAVHDPAEVELRGRLEALPPAGDALKFRFHYGAARVHFFDSTTQLKLDYARATDRDRAEKRMRQLLDPKTRERFTRVLGVVDNPFVEQFWRVLAYGRLTDWSFEFSVPKRGGTPVLEGFAAGLRERLPEFVPEEPRALLEADARDFLGLMFPALPQREDLERGTWDAGIRWRADGLETARGRKCLRFVNAERKTVTRREDEDGQAKQTDRREEAILYSPSDRLVLAHSREVKSAVVENQRSDSAFGSGKSRASVEWVRTTAPEPAAD